MQLSIPSSPQPKYEVEVQVFKSGCLINLFFKFVRCSSIGWTFKIKPAMNLILRAEQISHDNEADLEKLPIVMNQQLTKTFCSKEVASSIAHLGSINRFYTVDTIEPCD
jgi:hypothetical protein